MTDSKNLKSASEINHVVVRDVIDNMSSSGIGLALSRSHTYDVM